ncbi:hypothetical protein NC653_005684 [Populus alba x Populus x berolinensis]|uniref:Uncharacterized protein n=1 Tax=Populus alba x Populus x berolinensis TaxID=444605 RepID=A0AAD6WC60_9ROSI|nr:hypothetical protein NC653_005684 [Populus alba x Populus x berolinensis]
MDHRRHMNSSIRLQEKTSHAIPSAAGPTDGFTPVPLTEANFELLKPYNILLNDEDGRSYTVQLRPEDASTLILRVYDGNLRYYSGDLVATGLDDRWFRLNIIHDVDGDWATVDVDGEQKYSTKDRGPGDLHFKCGVYAAPRDITYYMESRASGPRHFIRSLAILRLWFWDRYNSGDLVATDLYDRRFRRNITHYMDEG